LYLTNSKLTNGILPSYLNAKVNVVRTGIVSASRALERGSGGEVTVRSGFVESAEQPVAHLVHVARVVVDLGSLVLQT
jgi:hypothetical protein